MGVAALASSKADYNDAVALAHIDLLTLGSNAT